MEIIINDKKADITTDKEKTIGDVLVGLENWLSDSGHRLSGISIDGKLVSHDCLEKVFSREINTVKKLDISTSSMHELSVQSLAMVYRDIEEYENLDFSGKAEFYNNWLESPQSRFISEQMPDMFFLCDKAFSGAEISVQALRAITEERLHEIENPVSELVGLEQLVAEVCVRLEDLPLDTQTGKDTKANQTVQMFAGVTEKIFRIISILTAQGYLNNEIKIEDIEIKTFISDFRNVVSELLDAYKNSDTVLIGDLCEYELAPKIRSLFSSISAVLLEKEIGEKT